jgi:hypothetical protein
MRDRSKLQRRRRSAHPIAAAPLAIVAAVAIGRCADAAPSAQPDHGVGPSRLLAPSFRPGQALTDIFARVIVIRPGGGFTEKKAYVSGMGTYVVSADSTPQDLKFELTYQYHGSPPAKGRAEIKDGGRTECLDGTCSASRDASGLVYNPAVWGQAPASLTVGEHWSVDLSEPWELGPAGHETVTVLAIDPRARTVTLKREGEGDGPMPGEPAQMHVDKDGKSFLVAYAGGHARWIGQTTFKDGVILSDEIMVYRTVTMSSPEIGTITAQFHEYTLQSLSPQPSDGSDVPV